MFTNSKKKKGPRKHLLTDLTGFYHFPNAQINIVKSKLEANLPITIDPKRLCKRLVHKTQQCVKWVLIPHAPGDLLLASKVVLTINVIHLINRKQWASQQQHKKKIWHPFGIKNSANFLIWSGRNFNFEWKKPSLSWYMYEMPVS